MYYYDYKASGMRIQKLRKQASMTQEELAEKLNISCFTFGRIERGIQGASIELLAEISAFFYVSIEYIAFGHENETQTPKMRIRSAIRILTELEKEL